MATQPDAWGDDYVPLTDEEIEAGQRTSQHRATQSYTTCRWCGLPWHGLPRQINSLRECLGSHQDQPPQETR